MAELDDAIRAFRNAHAAGDTAAATTLARYIQQIETQAPAPGGPFASLYEVSASPETPEAPTMGGEFGRSVESILSSLRTTGSAVFGDEEEAALAGLERQQKIGEEYGEGPSFERVKRAYEEDGLLSAAGEAVSQIPSAVAGQLPILGALGAGATAGQVAIPVPGLGAAIGAATVGVPLFFGSNIERQAETQQAEGVPVDISTGRALTAAVGQTALESAGAAATVGKGVIKSILKLADDAQLDSAAARNLTGAALAKLRGEAATPVTMGARAGAAGRGALTAAAVEIPTEIAQQVIERAQAGLDVLSPEALAEYGEAAYLAGIAGGTLGGATRVGEPGRVQRRAETRLREAAEQETQDLFAAEQERQGADKIPAGMQPDLFGELAPVMAPQTRAGEAQQEELRLQEQQREAYRTRGGEERFAPPGTFAATELPDLMEGRDRDVFDYMKSQGLTEATALETLPTKEDNEERITFNKIKALMNEQLVMAAAAIEAPRIPVAPDQAPLTLDPAKRIADLTPEERSVFERAVEAVRARRQKGTLGTGKGQQPLPKALTNILVGEEATAAKAEEAAAAKEREDAAADRAKKQADREAEAARKQALKDIAPAKVDLVGGLQARKTPIELAQDQELVDIAKAQKMQAGRAAPTTQQAAPAAPKFPTTREERVALAKEVGLNPSLAMVRNDSGILAQYANQDLTDPAVATRFASDLETAKKAFKGDYADRNSDAVNTLVARFAPKATQPEPSQEVVDDLQTADTQKTQPPNTEETSGDAQAPSTETETAQGEVAETEENLGVEFEAPAAGKRVVVRRVPISPEDVAVAEALAAQEVGEGLPTSDAQAAARYFRAYDPASALRVMVAEGVPKYTTTETVTTEDKAKNKAFARRAVRWVKANMSPEAAKAIAKHAKDFKNILSRTQVTAKKRAIRNEIDEAEVAARAEKAEQETTQKVDAALRKQEAASPTAAKKLDPATRAALKEVDKRVAEETGALTADTAVARSTRPEEKIDEERKLKSQKRMFELTGGKVTQLPPAGPEQIRQVIDPRGARTRQPMYLENATNSLKLEGDLLAAVQAGDLKQTISLLVGKMGQRPEAQQILRRFQSLGLKTKIVVAALGRPGEYDPITDTITLDPELGLNEHTLVHELSHAALANQIANPNSKVAKDFGGFFQIVKNQLGGTYGGTDVQEFAAEIMGNESFAAATKAMKAPKGGSLWDRIVQTIAEFFGFRKQQSVYDQAIKYIEELLNVPRSAEPTVTEKLFMGTPKSAAEALTSIGKEVRPVTREAQSDFRKLLRKVDGVDPKFEAVYSTALKAAFSLMRLQNIYDIYKDAGSKYTPLARALKKLSDSLERRLGEIERRSKVFNDKYNGWLKIANDKKYAAHMGRMVTLADEARRNGIDLVPENKFEPSKDQQQTYERLRNVLNNLPKPVRDMYLEMRRDYDKEFQANREFLLAQYRDNPTAYAEMKQAFEAQHALKGYIPDMRFGDFVLEYTEARTNRRVVQQFESAGERAQAIEQLKLKDGEYETYSRVTEATYDQKKVPDGSFLHRVMDDLNKTGASQKQLDTVYQAYLSMFPAQSLAKRMMRSENVAGQSKDLLRGYAATMMQWVRHRANAQYSPVIDEALDEIQAQRDVGGTHTLALNSVLNSPGSRDFLHNPTFNPLISTATGISFGAYILGNVSSAIINLTALPLGWNMLGAKYGYNAARKAMVDATKIITPLSLKDMTGDTKAWDNVPAKYRKLVDAMLDRGQLQHTQTREILEGRGKSSAEMGSGAAGLMVKALDLGSRPFNAAEKVNRGAIGIAAYEMARKGGSGVAPMTEAAAIEYAIEVVKNINTSGTAATGPRAFQTAPGRLIGTFKSFALNQVAVLGITAAKAFIGADPETRRVARRQVLGTYAVSGALAGVAGMPFVTSTVSILNSVMQGLFGDDDDDYEYFNSQEWMQDVLADWAYKGPINAFLNLSVADRTAITNNLAPTPDSQLVEDVGYVRAMIIQLAGPAAGVAVNVEKAITEAKEGRWGRVPEYLLPTAGANLFKAARFYRDGADVNKDGEPVDDDINAYNAVMQAIGFAPADRALIYQARTMALQFEAFVEQHKAQLLDAAWAAFNVGDTETFEEVRGRLVTLGQRYPGLVQNDTIERSFRSRAQSVQDSVTGVTLNSSLRPEQIRRFFDDLED